jgi:hypothetical protein
MIAKQYVAASLDFSPASKAGWCVARRETGSKEFRRRGSYFPTSYFWM